MLKQASEHQSLSLVLGYIAKNSNFCQLEPTSTKIDTPGIPFFQIFISNCQAVRFFFSAIAVAESSARIANCFVDCLARRSRLLRSRITDDANLSCTYLWVSKVSRNFAHSAGPLSLEKVGARWYSIKVYLWKEWLAKGEVMSEQVSWRSFFSMMMWMA